MKQNANFRSCILLLILTICCFACQQPASKAKQPVDKVVLLQLIKKLVVTESRTPGKGIALLRSFALDHDLQIIDSNKVFKDTTVLQVRFNPDKEFLCYCFNLPLDLQKQLTYHDLDQVYGVGIESPRPKEPTGFGVMYFVKDYGNIAIVASSRFPPSVTLPMIYQITVML